MGLRAELPYLLLHHVPGLGPKRLQSAQQIFASPNQLLSQDARFWRETVRLPASGWLAIQQWQTRQQYSELFQRATRDLEWQDAAADHHIIHRNHADYPPMLSVLHDPPNVLYVRGNLSCLSQPQVAVVGARAASRTGLHLAQQFAQALSAQGWLVSSGLAKGIDGAVHQGCLDGGFPTLAVLGSGLQSIYPRIHQRMADTIVLQGALVSEFPVHVGAKPFHFPQRNRIIAGLCQGLLVVEAAEKSGSLITAQMALEGGKDVFAVPGNPLNPLTKGCHRLIQQGAGLAVQAEDILNALPAFTKQRPITPQPQPDCVTGAAAVSGHSDLDSEQGSLSRSVLQWVSFDGSSFAQIEADCQLPTETLMRVLLVLELSGAVVSEPGGYCRLR